MQTQPPRITPLAARPLALWLGLGALGIVLALSGCPEDSEDGSSAGSSGAAGQGGTGGTGGGDSGQGGTGGATDPEAASGLGLVALYAGTWQVTGDGHSRGTVIISADGSQFDFDADKQFQLDGDDVYNRIPQFIDTEPRVQIEIPGTPQQRLRIFVDPADTGTPLRFAYYPNAVTDDNAVTVTVQ
jgi:hypothetical protein